MNKDDMPKYVNFVLNVAISVGVGVYYYDGWAAALYAAASFAVLNTVDVALDFLRDKFRKGENNE